MAGVAGGGGGDEAGLVGLHSVPPPQEHKSRVTVAVRVRGLDTAGYRDDDQPAIFPNEADSGRSLVIDGASRGATAFTFDSVFWSLAESKSKYPAYVTPPPEATQEDIYRELGAPVVQNTLAGFNCSVFAYGQTGSGKTFTMMGHDAHDPSLRGLIPRISEALFEATTTPAALVESNAVGTYEVTHSFVVSYVEIYMERVQDLLVEGPCGGGVGLKVREHPKTGPYVDGCTLVRVYSIDQIKALIELGNRNRAVAATSLNSYSSRSHAVFSIHYIKSRRDMENGALMHQTSKLNLIDLAGSENASAAGTTGERLKEGGSINKSLLTLGLVIKQLSQNAQKKGPKPGIIPYRDSVLTYLLKDSLGGNSRTTVLATVRPGLGFYEESLSTLKYASRARTIVNTAIINEDPLTRKIRLLQEQIELLTRELAHSHEREAHRSQQLSDMSHRLLTLTGELPPGATQVLGDGPVEALPSPSSLALQRSAAMHALTQEESEAGGGAASQNEGRKRLLGLEPEKGEEAVAMADGAATPATALVGEENGEETPETPTTDDLFFTDPQRKPRRPISAKALRPIPGLKEGISSPPLFYGPAPAPGASPRAMLVTSPRKGSVSAAADGAMMTVPPSPFQAGAKILDGFLFKRGQLTGAFYRRWFVIRGSRLFWFSRYKDEESIRGALSLKDHDVQPCAEPGAEADSSLPYAFAMRHKLDPKARVHVLQASSLEERDKWVSALRLAALLEDELADQVVMQEPLARLLHTPCPIM